MGLLWLGIPQATEWQCIGNQIDGAMIFAEADFVNVHRMHNAVEPLAGALG
jgi:hypothetical protein